MRNLPPKLYWRILPWFLISGLIPFVWLSIKYLLNNQKLFLIDGVICVVLVVCVAIFFTMILVDLCLRPVPIIQNVFHQLLQSHTQSTIRDRSYRELYELSVELEILSERLDFRFQILVQQQKELEVILSNMVEGVLVVNSNLEIQQMNQRFADIFDCTQNISVGKQLQSLVRNPNLIQFIDNLLHTQTELVDEISLIGDHDKHILITGNIILNAQKKLIGVLVVVNDITNVHKLEGIRKEFVANVSHELKTPITSIKGFVETLLEEEDYEQKQTRKFLKIILKHADRLNLIIEDLLTLARFEQENVREELDFEIVDIYSIVNNAFENYRSVAEFCEIELRLENSEHYSIKANARLIEQAIGNLIDNAIKYCEPKKQIFVTTEVKPDKILIKVIDQGCGISSKHLPRLFERFYRVDKSRSRQMGGTGLGLAIVKHIALVHGGAIEVVSEKDVGSTFTLILPGATEI